MKRLLFLTATTLCLLSSLALSQEIEWQNTIGGMSMDIPHAVEQTSDGGYILGGESASDISGDKTENCNGMSDYWILKTNSSGVIQWQNTIGGSDMELLYSVKQTADGGYILGGSSRSDISGDKSENCIGSADYWIVKTDSVGVVLWQNTIGGGGEDYLQSLQQTSDGGFILGGYSNSPISGDKTEISIGFGDYWIVKTDSLGNIQWQNTIGGSLAEALYFIEQTDDGGYIMGGLSESYISGDKTENSLGLRDYWLVKTDSAGNIQWQNTIGGISTDILYAVDQTDDGGFILGGYSLSNISGDKTENSNGLSDYWIVKTDSLGNIQWQNTIGGGDEDFLQSLQQTSDGGFILGGYSSSPISGDKTENSTGMYDYWIVKTDSLGNIQWQNTIGGSLREFQYSLMQSNDGSYLLSGCSESNISGDKTENCQGLRDYWMVNITDQYNLITGKLYIDANNNNSQDAGESILQNKQIKESITGRIGFSQLNGQYNVSVMDSGNFSVSVDSVNYYNIIPITHSASFIGILQTDSLNDFAFQPTGVFNDLCVSITPLGPFRAGFNASYQITYENVGTTTLSPTVIFIPDADVSYVSASPVASTVTIDSVVWNFGPLAPFQPSSILITVNVNTGIPIGTLINSGARIEPLLGDANPNCNSAFWEVFTIASNDPNDIIVDEDTLLTTQFPNPPYLEYLIRFQNTGNDTAFTVKILNPIDTTFFDLPSFEYVASSHPVNLNWISWEKNMDFRFENILLPDSNVNQPASHGFIRYRIKPKSSLTLGDSITNNAAIYFDFNAPVITNTAITQVILPTSVSETIASYDNLLLYPSPANSILTIETVILHNSECHLIIKDVAGRTLYSKPIPASSTKHDIDVSSFSAGIYFVQLQDDEKNARGRFVKK